MLYYRYKETIQTKLDLPDVDLYNFDPSANPTAKLTVGDLAQSDVIQFTLTDNAKTVTLSHTVAGGDANTARSWMHAENSALRGRPVDLIQTVTGLVNVLGYLDSRRAIV